MLAYLGFDDTDTLDSAYGTGKLVRWFEEQLPEGCVCRGVVRQQLLVDAGIPYTSHNSAACMITELADAGLLGPVIEKAVRHLEYHFADGSDPGLCVATEGHRALGELVAFGRQCTRDVASQQQALAVTRSVHLSGHGGTNDGIIGAAAAVGLTASGWSGRFIELENLRAHPPVTTVEALQRKGIEVASMDRDALMPAPEDRVFTNGWVRPRLMGNRPVLFVCPKGDGLWENIYCKRKKG
jgi:hypothetical protein